MADVKSSVKSRTSSNAFLNYLMTTDLSPALHRPCLGAIVTFQKTTSVSTVFKRLSSDGILSAPVLDGTRYVGFISIYDIMNFITNMYWGETGEEWETFFDNNDDFLSSTVDDVMETFVWRGRQAAQPLYTTNSTLHCLEKLAVTGGHRAAVLDPKNSRVVNIMTQSMIISEIQQRISLLPWDLRNMTVNDMTQFWTQVHNIKETDRAINAFLRMRDSSINGLAIVNDEGVLTGSISVRDLRGLGTDGVFFSRLFLTVKEFKDTVAREYPFLGAKNHFYVSTTPIKGLCVTPSSSFEAVLNMMKDGCIHRVFVCSEESLRANRPIAYNVITQSDMLMAVLRYFTFPSSEWRLNGYG
jgi:CBS domain-containing protein